MQIGKAGMTGNDIKLRVTPPAAEWPTHVQEHEVAEARRLIDEMFIKLTGKPFDYKTCGWLITLKIYIRPDELAKGKREDGSEYTIWRPQMTATNDKYQSVAALVVGMGPDAYQDVERYHQPWCRIGDWVTIPRYEAHLFEFRGVALGTLPEDRIMGVISDPTDVSPIHTSDKV